MEVNVQLECLSLMAAGWVWIGPQSKCLGVVEASKLLYVGSLYCFFTVPTHHEPSENQITPKYEIKNTNRSPTKLQGV